MIVKNNSKVIDFDIRSVNNNEIQQINIPDFAKTRVVSGAVKVNDDFYFAKPIDDYRMLVELVGTKLSKIIDLDTVDYKIGMWDGRLHALSKIFYKDNCDYSMVASEYRLRPINLIDKDFRKVFNNFYLCETSVLNIINDNELLENILKLIAIDLKMKQFDRHDNNVLLEKDEDGVIKLAPVFDYSLAYSSYRGIGLKNYYDCPFLIVKRNVISLKSLIRKYPNIYKYLLNLREINISDIVLEIEKENNVEFTDSEIRRIVDEDDHNNMLLKKL